MYYLILFAAIYNGALLFITRIAHGHSRQCWRIVIIKMNDVDGGTEKRNSHKKQSRRLSNMHSKLKWCDNEKEVNNLRLRKTKRKRCGCLVLRYAWHTAYVYIVTMKYNWRIFYYGLWFIVSDWLVGNRIMRKQATFVFPSFFHEIIALMELCNGNDDGTKPHVILCGHVNSTTTKTMWKLWKNDQPTIGYTNDLVFYMENKCSRYVALA